VKLFEEGNIRPMVGKTFEWEQAKEAFRHSIERGTVGKFVIKV
jgi:NADPH:quinone reductase-like Zn-dependent oxidoreductase